MAAILQHEQRLPLTGLFAALIAFAALFFTYRSPLIPLAGALLCAGWLAPVEIPRMQDRTWPLWLARTAAAGVILFATPRAATSGMDGIMDARFTVVAGTGCAAWLALRFWQEAADPMVRYRDLVVFSGSVLIFACNTFETGYVRFLAPAYLACLCLTFILTSRPQLAAAGRPVARSLLRGTAVCLAFGVGYGLYYGLSTYRNELTTWSNRLLLPRNGGGGGGISASPTMRDVYNPEMSPLRTFRVEGLEGPAHMRALVFDTYAQGQWSPPVYLQKFKPATDADLHAYAPGPRLRFTRFRDDLALLILPANTTGVPEPERLGLRWAPESGSVRGQGPFLTPFSYQATVGREGARGPLLKPIETPGDRARYLQLPDNLDPRVRALARAIGRGGPLPIARVRAVEAYLPANHRYSLRYHVERGDPVTDFLLRKAAAHCQYFAASAVILLRCLGVPARYVTGYYAHERDRAGVTTVRQRDAHAWAEAWIDGRGWMTVDATPGDGMPDQSAKPVPVWVRAWERFQDGLAAFGARFGNPGVMGWVWLIGGLTAAYVILRSWRDLFRRTRRGPAPVSYSAPAGITAFARRFEALLGRSGAPCPAHRTWQEHLAVLGEADGPGGKLDLARASVFVEEYNAARFGADGEPSTHPRLAELMAALERRERKACGPGEA